MGRRGRGRLNKKTLTATEIDIYTAYLKGTRKHEAPRGKGNGDYRELTGVGVVPFGVGLPASGTINHVRTSMTRGARGILDVLAITATAQGNIFGLEFDGTKVSASPAGFYPALAVITLIPAAAVAITTGTSAFTGRPRNYKPGRSGSVPFGRGTVIAQPEGTAGKKANAAIDDIEFMDAVKAVRDVITGSAYAGDKRVSIQPEIYRPEVREPGFGKAAVAPAL